MRKLPKQWLYWAKKCKIKPTSLRCSHRGLYLKGADRFWRVDCYGNFECSCPIEYFDRWSNSRGSEVNFIPSTEKEFMETIKKMIDHSKDCK